MPPGRGYGNRRPFRRSFRRPMGGMRRSFGRNRSFRRGGFKRNFVKNKFGRTRKSMTYGQTFA